MWCGSAASSSATARAASRSTSPMPCPTSCPQWRRGCPLGPCLPCRDSSRHLLLKRPHPSRGVSPVAAPLRASRASAPPVPTAPPASKKERPTDAAGEILAEFESASAAPHYRDVTIVDAGEPKRIDLRIEVPLDDMSRLDRS